MYTIKSTLCSKRNKTCSYCELSLHADKLDDHMIYCGARTELCELCGRYIQLKCLDEHNLKGCNYPEPVVTHKEPSTSLRTEDYGVYAGAMLDANVDLVDDLIPCEFCFKCFDGDTLIQHQVCCFYLIFI